MANAGHGAVERKRTDPHPLSADLLHDSTADDEISRPGGRWSLWLIEAVGLLLIAALWTGVVLKVSWEEVAEDEAIEHRTMGLARIFEEHSIRTLEVTGH